MHFFRTITDSLFTEPPAYAGRSEGFRRAELIGAAEGSVHMEFAIAALGAGGRVDAAFIPMKKASSFWRGRSS